MVLPTWSRSSPLSHLARRGPSCVRWRSRPCPASVENGRDRSVPWTGGPVDLGEVIPIIHELTQRRTSARSDQLVCPGHVSSRHARHHPRRPGCSTAPGISDMRALWGSFIQTPFFDRGRAWNGSPPRPREPRSDGAGRVATYRPYPRQTSIDARGYASKQA